MATDYLRETLELGSWHAWAGQRLTWLHQRMLAGDLPAGPAASTAPTAPTAPTTPAASAPPRAPASAGSLLLAAGAFLLVVAGIAFLAFTWDLLGPFGQIAVLLVLGAACLAAARGLAGRLHGTAIAVGVVGTLLVLLASLGTRTLGPDLIGPAASMLLAVVISAALCVAAVWLRPHVAGVGELAGVVGALSAVTYVATAPADEAVPLGGSWSWWVGLVCLGAGVALLVVADAVRLRSWPWVGAWFLAVGSVAVAAAVQDAAAGRVASDVEPVVVAATLAVLVVALAVVLLRLLPHRAATTTATLAVWALALMVAWGTAVSAPAARPWAGLVLVAAGLLGLVPKAFDLAVTWLKGTVGVTGAAAVGAGVGTLVAPWINPWHEYLGAEAWADAAWPAWRGALAGLVLVAVLVASVAAAPTVLRAFGAPRGEASPAWRDALPLVPGAAALLTWLTASSSDLAEATTGGPYAQYPFEPQPAPEAFAHQLAIALGLVALGLLAVTLVRRLPKWCVWPAGALGVAAALFELSTRNVAGSVRPEAYGAALALPALASAVGWWWLRRPRRTPTWQTIGPVLSLAVLPSTLALADDTTQRWWYAEEPGTAYQVRLVVLLGIGVVAAVVGAWRRRSGLFFPGLALTVVVVGIELVELGRFLPQWVSFAVAGAALVAAGARWEWVREHGREGAAWVRTLH